MSADARADLADAVAARLTVPTTVGPSAAKLSQSLARGAPGTALLHIERARAGRGDWSTVHAWLAAATRTPINAGPDASLYVGAPAVAFAVHTAAARSERYQRALTTLHATVRHLTRDRLDRAHGRLARGDPPAFTEFDLLYGLTGLGAYHLQVDPDGDDLRQVLRYLVRLTKPIRRHGDQFPGWWTDLSPTRQRSADFAGGHGNLGMAHGIAGPLAVLALAARRGIVVDGHRDAIEQICSWFDAWRQDPGPGDTGPWWPQWITDGERRAGQIRQLVPTRRTASWCYGTPGIARAQQLAAIATGDQPRKLAAEHALASCLAEAVQPGRVVDAGLCHGWAGLILTARRAAADATTGTAGHPISAFLPRLTDALIRHVRAGSGEDEGLLDGDAGVALALHTADLNGFPSSGWDTCLLIA